MMELSVMVIQMLNRTQEKNRKGNLEFCYLNLFYSNFEIQIEMLGEVELELPYGIKCYRTMKYHSLRPDLQKKKNPSIETRAVRGTNLEFWVIFHEYDHGTGSWMI
ncbi:hypothetical protein C5167_011825 [Papaver somniferum]|nr:hypothetical protein C5167_011825 [Papaver somniferum]